MYNGGFGRRYKQNGRNYGLKLNCEQSKISAVFLTDSDECVAIKERKQDKAWCVIRTVAGYKSCKAHPKSAIQIRNKYMVNRSDLVIFYVETTSGGAYQTMKYADKQCKNIINILE